MIDYTLFIVDDDESVLTGLTMGLEESYTVYGFPTAEQALAAADDKQPDLILLDISLPGMNGISALKQFQELAPDLLVIMITALEDIRTVITCMKSGAHDFVIKPLNMEALEVTIANALDTIRLRKEVQQLQKRYLEENHPCFIGKSNAIHEIMEFIDMVALSPDTPVLILGDSGTGKEYIASAIHFKSPNFKGPFISINCSAIPDNLIESELFGYETGAFTGALSSGKKGLVEEAVGGTLFLDEVGDMPLPVQAKLLRFLEEGEFYKLGSVRQSTAKTRIVSATNKDLDRMIREGSFRKDLYFRLGVVPIRVPSLNERKEDILPLAKFFLDGFARKFNKPITALGREVEEFLLQYSWSGNVRELKNMVERGVLSARQNELTPENMGLDMPGPGQVTGAAEGADHFSSIPPAGFDLSEFHNTADRFYFKQALAIAQGKETKAAKLLHMNYHTFRNRKKKLFPNGLSAIY